jgi:hypothetical protein
VFHRRSIQEAEGGPEEKHAEAFTQSVTLWLALNPPLQRSGRCAQCNRRIDIPGMISGAPVLIDRGWVHWACAPAFCRGRWDRARAALQQFGITENVF